MVKWMAVDEQRRNGGQASVSTMPWGPPGYDARMKRLLRESMAGPRRATAAEAPPDDDFRAAMSGVQRRDHSDRLPPVRRTPSPRPLQAEADEREVLADMLRAEFEMETVESTEVLAYRAPGLQDAVWRRLRRGTYRIGAELDLHGHNREAARAAVAAFLAECQDRGLRCLRIIHGKGRGSPNSGPVIKSLLDSWLRRRRDVLAFCSARPHDGGTGAVYVLLRSTAVPPSATLPK